MLQYGLFSYAPRKEHALLYLATTWGQKKILDHCVLWADDDNIVWVGAQVPPEAPAG